MDEAIRCGECGQRLAPDANACAHCGKVMLAGPSPLRFFPLALFFTALLVFALLGGDPSIEEVNMYDFLSGIIAIFGLILSFVSIPKRRKALRAASIALNIAMLLLVIIWVL